MNPFAKKNKTEETTGRVKKVHIETVNFGDMVVKMEVTRYVESNEKPGQLNE